MNMHIVWPLWIGCAFISFAIFEGYAIVMGHETLSQWVLVDVLNHPILRVVGTALGLGLIAHLFWRGRGALDKKNDQA